MAHVDSGYWYCSGCKFKGDQPFRNLSKDKQCSRCKKGRNLCQLKGGPAGKPKQPSVSTRERQEADRAKKLAADLKREKSELLAKLQKLELDNKSRAHPGD